jgi:hypothetical protein
MSSVVKTSTPFLSKELLLKALDAVGCKYTVADNTIITDRVDYYGNQKFEFQNGRYVFLHDSSSQDMIYGPHYPWGNIDMKQYKQVGAFIAILGREYNAIYKRQLEDLERKRLAAIAEAEQLRLRKEQFAEQERLRLLAKAEEERKKAEEEKQRLERERKEYVARQRSTIIEKAREQGYDVQETVVGNKIKLVLVQTTY